MTEGIATTTVTESFVASANIPYSKFMMHCRCQLYRWYEVLVIEPSYIILTIYGIGIIIYRQRRRGGAMHLC